MRIFSIQLRGMRCFDETGDVELASGCNIFVGKNNCGKSTLLKSILNLQHFPFMSEDMRHGAEHSLASVVLADVTTENAILVGPPAQGTVRFTTLLRGMGLGNLGDHATQIGIGQPIFPAQRPNHAIIPFLAKRKAVAFSEHITSSAHEALDGTLASLYSRIDMLATAGHPKHDLFMKSVKEIVGLPITTRSSPNGKQAGYYFDDNNFVTLERMGDGVSEMMALIVELCTERGKIFVLEEPETNLHPSGLKLLLSMVRDASASNQFIIATHSNVVVRELGGLDNSKVFRVFRDGDKPTDPSVVEEVEATPAAHIALLRDLGYDFSDFEIHDAWLFLEESSAERIIRDILMSKFVPQLVGRLRTYSAGGVANMEPSISEFQRLIVFVHLQPVYAGRLWAIVDGDEIGQTVVKQLRSSFSEMDDSHLRSFLKPQFEMYYPDHFSEKVQSVLALSDKQEKRKAKARLLQDVLDWTEAEPETAIAQWEESASEVIEFLRDIAKTLASGN